MASSVCSTARLRLIEADRASLLETTVLSSLECQPLFAHLSPCISWLSAASHLTPGQISVVFSSPSPEVPVLQRPFLTWTSGCRPWLFCQRPQIDSPSPQRRVTTPEVLRFFLQFPFAFPQGLRAFTLIGRKDVYDFELFLKLFHLPNPFFFSPPLRELSFLISLVSYFFYLRRSIQS